MYIRSHVCMSQCLLPVKKSCSLSLTKVKDKEQHEEMKNINFCWNIYFTKSFFYYYIHKANVKLHQNGGRTPFTYLFIFNCFIKNKKMWPDFILYSIYIYYICWINSSSLYIMDIYVCMCMDKIITHTSWKRLKEKLSLIS